MVIGNGLLARSFHEYAKRDDIVVFASGVSNSKEMDTLAFEREKNLLLQTLSRLKNQIIIYFSTCSIADPSLQNSAYVLHKKEMEKLIIQMASKWYILRLPQVVGPTKSPTLIHFLFESIVNQKFLHIQTKATRNLIWYEDIFMITDKIINEKYLENHIINVASPYHLKVTEIVELIEKELNIPAQKILEDQGGSYIIDTGMIDDIAIKMHIFPNDYPKKVIEKYAFYNKGENQ